MSTWYAVAHPGLEPIVAAELAEHGLHGDVVPGGVRFSADMRTLAGVLRMLRTPDRMLLELGTGPCRSLDEFTGLLKRMPWKTVILPQAVLDVSVTTKSSKLHFRDPLEKKAAWLVGEALKGPRIVDGSPRARLTQRIQVRIEDDHATVSIDGGGDLLHKRGWKKEVGKAPLRENLAAALLRAAGWTGREPLVDPFCGSGTLPIEAALLAAGRSPYVGRLLACSEWPALMGASRALGDPAPRRALPLIVGADRDGVVLGSATENARRAGVDVKWVRADIGQLEPPAPTGLVVANPPWGVRLATGAGTGPDAAAIYARFGQVMQTRFAGWRVAFLAPEVALASRVHPQAHRVTIFPTGGMRVALYTASF